jgi:radical SAM-linked protein
VPYEPEALVHWYLIRYTKTGASRFLSQHDTRRTWERVTRRGNLPLAYSRGFSPKPRLSFGPPLSVGAEGFREFMALALRDSIEPSLVRERLSHAAIPGMEIRAVTKAEGRRVHPTWARYRLTPRSIEEDLPTRIEKLLASNHFEIHRPRDPEERNRDIRPGISMLTLIAPHTLHARLRLTSGEIVTPRDLGLALDVDFTTIARTDIELAAFR